MNRAARITFSLLVLVGLGGGPTISYASENRVEATGGLTTIMTDETNDLSLFLDGNPAGLALLNTRSRFDLSGQWFYSDQEGPWGSNKQQLWTTIPRVSDNSIRYGGLMLFPTPNWSFQVLGDFLSAQGLPVYMGDTYTLSQYRGLVRAAYALPFGALGVEILNIESDKNYDSGLLNSYTGLSSGSSGQNQLLLKTGIAAAFPSPASPDSPRWQAGGFFTAQLGSNIENQNLSLYYSNNSAFPVNQTIFTTDYYSYGCELLYEIPQRVKILFSADFTNSNANYDQSVAFYDNTTKSKLAYFQTLNVDCATRLIFPFSEQENLNLGGSVGVYLTNTPDFLGDGTEFFQAYSNRQQISTRFGIGLESPKEYTFGLQWKSQNYVAGSQDIVSKDLTASNNGFDLYQVAFGGERWLSPTWAFRLGMVLEEDIYAGGNPDTLTTTVNAGFGVEKVFGRVDFRLFLGQTTDNNDLSNTIGFLGSQISTTLFL